MAQDDLISAVCRRGLKRLLFFTYSFRFHWFHNELLPRLQRVAASNRGFEVTIIANVIDAQEFIPNVVSKASSDLAMAKLWNMKEWCSLGDSMRIFMISENTILHNKLIIAEYDHGERFLIGIGSANLTGSGWMSNLEFWNWPNLAIVPDVCEFLNELVQRKYVPDEVLSGWLKALSRQQKSGKLLWLYPGNRKSIRREAAFDSLMTVKKPIAKLRVVSPYFDDGSIAVMKKLWDRIDRNKPEIELWFDYSGIGESPTWLEHLVNLCEEYGIRKVYYPLKKNRPKSPPIRDIITLHGKLIEVVDISGGGRRILGSANFTGAAWIKSNWETVHLESFKPGQNLYDLLEEKYDLQNNGISVKEIKKKFAKGKSAKASNGQIHQQMEILWAIYNEKKSTLSIRYRLNNTSLHVMKVEIKAHYDTLRDIGLDKEELEKVKNVAKIFERPDRWDEQQISDRMIIWHRKDDLVEQIPETLSIKITLSGGSSGYWPVFLTSPQFSNWDAATGIPKGMQTALEALAGEKPIAKPVGPRDIIWGKDDLNNEEDDEDDDCPGDDPEPFTQLSTDPHFNHLPEVIKMLQLFKQADASDQKAMEARLRTFVRKSASKPALVNDNLIARAFLEALK